MDKKKWYLSKTIWSAIVGGLIAAYNSIGPQFGWPVIPDFVFGILAAIGIYGRATATTTLK